MEMHPVVQHRQTQCPIYPQFELPVSCISKLYPYCLWFTGQTPGMVPSDARRKGLSLLNMDAGSLDGGESDADTDSDVG